MTKAKDRLDLWTGEFGDEYHRRNATADESIIARWKWLFSVLPAPMFLRVEAPWSILEIGCGQGANLAALRGTAKDGSHVWNLYGIEPNLKARMIAAEYAPVAGALPIGGQYKWPAKFDLVLTCGLLIHIPPAGLDDMLDLILDISNHYILIAEYFAPDEEEVPYRGQQGALWRRDYGSLLTQRGNLEGNPFRVEHIAHGFLWKPVDGLDNLVWWLFEKVPV